MKKLNLLWVVLLLLTACGKDPLPTDVVTTNSRDNNGTIYIQRIYDDGTEQYFKVLSDNTAEVVRALDYYGIKPPIEYGSNTEVIPSEITYDGQVYTIVGIGDLVMYSGSLHQSACAARFGIGMMNSIKTRPRNTLTSRPSVAAG